MKTKEVFMGTFYGHELILKVPEDDSKDYAKLLEDNRANDKKQAIQEYKDELILEKMRRKSKKGFWGLFLTNILK